jgi:hypothetical protein
MQPTNAQPAGVIPLVLAPRIFCQHHGKRQGNEKHRRKTFFHAIQCPENSN